MSISQDFCDAFINSWYEHIDDKLTEIVKNRCKIKYVIVFTDDNLMKWYELKRPSLYCFFDAFKGSVCDEVHWKYFQDCLNKTRRIKHIKGLEMFRRIFIYYWNNGIEQFKLDNEKYDGNLIDVVCNNVIMSYELTPNALQCFHTIFNGTFCDKYHWEYFKYCLEQAAKITGIDTETYEICKIQNYDKPENFSL